MHFTPGSIIRIDLPGPLWEDLTAHCRRKLRGEFLADETGERKAFGLIAGTVQDRIVTVAAVSPLARNARAMDNRKSYMDEMMARHAIPSETPLNQRGWVADPEELQGRLQEFKACNNQLLGAYHMHRVAWEHDPGRDTPTELDRILGADSRMFMFIVSMVNPDRPIIRAFFEGRIGLEVLVVIGHES